MVAQHEREEESQRRLDSTRWAVRLWLRRSSLRPFGPGDKGRYPGFARASSAVGRRARSSMMKAASVWRGLGRGHETGLPPRDPVREGASVRAPVSRTPSAGRAGVEPGESRQYPQCRSHKRSVCGTRRRKSRLTQCDASSLAVRSMLPSPAGATSTAAPMASPAGSSCHQDRRRCTSTCRRRPARTARRRLQRRGP